ncbi:MAG: DUF222 domain-containing protein, partial [Acidimicrobiia bacterium]
MFGDKGEIPATTGLPAGEVDHLSGWDCDVDMLAAGLDADLVDEPDRHHLPTDLDDWLPGPYLAAILSSVEYSRLSGEDVVTAMKAYTRLEAHMSAGRYSGISETALCLDPVTTDRSDWPLEFATEEVGAALTLTRRKAEDELETALDLRHRLPSVATALQRGDIDAAKARLLCHDTAHLDADVAHELTDELLVDSAGLTTGQLRARLRKLCVDEDPR